MLSRILDRKTKVINEATKRRKRELRINVISGIVNMPSLLERRRAHAAKERRL
jgi:hypothetical protein